MKTNEDKSVDLFSDDYWDSAYRIKDIVFEIMLSGVTSIPGIVMELNRQAQWRNFNSRNRYGVEPSRYPG